MSDTDGTDKSEGATGSPGIPPARRGRRRHRGLALALVVLVGACSAATGRLFVWPELPPLPDQADAIVELGGPGARRPLALDLHRTGRAPVVAISVSADEAGTSWCDRGNLDGVPVICFRPDPYTTRGEARAVAELARQHGWRSVILVTSPDQAWRATVRVSRCFDGEITVATTPLPPHRWPQQIAHQWIGTAKAFTYETSC
jgi:hypothetical protein